MGPDVQAEQLSICCGKKKKAGQTNVRCLRATCPKKLGKLQFLCLFNVKGHMFGNHWWLFRVFAAQDWLHDLKLSPNFFSKLKKGTGM